MDVLTTSPGASSTYPHHHHHHHHHQQSHHHSLIRADGGTAEVKKTQIAGTNGWHAGKRSSSIETSAQQQDSRMSPKSGKGKAKETDDVRSPRRLAASKALQQVVRNSAPPASSTKDEQGEASSSATKAATNLASSADAVDAAVSSSSPTIRQSSSSSTLLPNGFVRERSARTSSPSSPLARGRRVAASQSPLLPETSDTVRTDIDDAEMNQFHFQAYPQSKTAILPRAPPTLPYDASYLPLSPMGTDQVGHTLQAPNLPANGTSGKAAETAKTGTKAGGQGKKVLPGQELESHIVSELPGQKAMPWGLQTTLMEKQHAGPRARTKSGMVKRTAVREGRRSVVKARGNDVHDGVLPLKVEDDLLSENDSPRLPLIQVSSAAPDTAVLDDENAEGGKASVLENGAKSEKETTPSQQGGDTKMTEVTASTRQNQAVTPPPRASPAKGRARISEYTSPAASSSAMTTTSAGEESPHAVDSTAGSTRRPREAHKRLKIVGGYYRKPGMHREDVMQQSESSNGSMAGPSRAKNGGAARSSSRGTSFAPDEENADTAVNARSSSEEALSGKREGNRAASIGEEAAGSLATSATPSVQPALAGSAAAIGSSLRRMTTAPPSQGSPSKLMHASGEASAADDNAEGNNEFCETCRGVGHFICCDGCPRSFHFACINPPLDVDELPKSVGDASDTWYCNVCRAERRPKAKAGKRTSSGGANVLDPLLRYIDGENPSIFALPHDVRNYFKGVATANDGSYVDSSMLRPIKVNKYGIVDEREPLRLKDKNGKPIFCYRCGESAMPHEEQEEEQKSSQASTNPSSSPQKGGRSRPQRQAAKIATAAVMSNSMSSSIGVEADESKGWRKMISCDFCALHWHLDCLDPPLASMPSLRRKWMCPNNIEHVMPSERIPKSVANSTTVHELPVPSKETIGPGKHYRMRVVNDGQIDIIPDPLDTYTGPAHDGLEDGLPPPPSSSATLSTKYGSGDKGWEEMNLPAYKAYPTVFGSSNNVKLKYRIPEKVIRLDFWSKLDLHREQLAEAALRKKQDMDRQGLDMLALIANAASASTLGSGGEISGDDTMRKVETRAEKEKKRKLNIGEAKELIAALHHQPEHPYVAPGEEPVSTLRQSFIPGEYEREFDGEDDETKADPPVGMKNSTSSHGEGSSSSAHNDDDVDLEDHQLQAIRKIIAHKGKEALLRFLLE